ncbi:hypothetical protein V0288_03595 [Pannus brasiliensis CCIBt3594]|uniref:Uncharacterized protein n=1 Tax=Pannus brasiliensis CCIBt3594 TaxID=1427578 RepID=A0AAW9QQA7_9CHRO
MDIGAMLTNPENPELNHESREDIPERRELPIQPDPTSPDIPSEKTIADKKDNTRPPIATSLIRLLWTTLIASFSAIAVLTVSSFILDIIDREKAEQFEKTISLVKDLIALIWTAQTGLIGTAIGFYFGSKSGNSD